MDDFHFPFQKVIKFVHVNVHQELTGEIAQRQTDVRLVFGVKTPDYFTQEQYRIFALDMFFQNITQNLLVDIGEKFSNIAFQDPDRSRLIPRNLASLVAKAIYGAVRAFDAPTRVRVENKLGVEIRI